MKKISFVLLTAVLMIVLASCTRDRGPRPYDPGPVQYTFVDEFDDDRNGWSFSDPVNLAYGVVQGGTFRFDYNDDYSEAYYVSRDVGLNTNSDFTLQTRIGSNNNMGLLFGYDDRTQAYGYSFMVDYDGYYALYDEGGNGYGPDVQGVVQKSGGNFVNPNGDWNALRLEQRGNRWIGYINDVQVFNIEAQQMRGAGVGFVNVALTQGEADYLQVDWLQ